MRTEIQKTEAQIREVYDIINAIRLIVDHNPLDDRLGPFLAWVLADYINPSKTWKIERESNGAYLADVIKPFIKDGENGEDDAGAYLLLAKFDWLTYDLGDYYTADYEDLIV